MWRDVVVRVREELAEDFVRRTLARRGVFV
jgi:hypothetical protein